VAASRAAASSCDSAAAGEAGPATAAVLEVAVRLPAPPGRSDDPPRRSEAGVANDDGAARQKPARDDSDVLTEPAPWRQSPRRVMFDRAAGPSGAYLSSGVGSTEWLMDALP